MQYFDGFQSPKDEMINVPSQFFNDLLPIIDDLGELKITLYCFWGLQRQEGQYRYIRLQEALADDTLCDGFQQTEHIVAAFQRAQERGTLLAFEAELQGQPDVLYFFNSPRGRAALEALQNGQWYPDGMKRPVGILEERPNIFALYEQNIGHITPMIAEKLKDAEDEFPAQWIAEAMERAVENNARKWSYIIAILDRWKTDGRQQQRHETAKRSDSQFGDKKGDFSDFFNT